MKKYLPLLFIFVIASFSLILFQNLKSPESINVPPPTYEDLEKGAPNLKTFSMKQDQLLRAMQEIQSRGESQGLAQDMEWLEKGPVNVGGRTRVFFIDQRDPTENTVFAAGVSGGLWKTENLLEQELISTGPDGELLREGGTVWEKIPFDFPNLGICALVQDPNNLDVLYAGTGEFWVASGVDGAGIWKSTDGGNNWEHLSSTANQQFTFTNRLLFDQNGWLYAATADSGILRTKNGGQSWEVVLDAVSGTISNIASDIELAANGDLYAAFGGWGEYDHIYKSKAGSQVGDLNNWDRIVLPDTLQRKEIACAPGQANRVYVIGAENSNMTGFFVSDDGGQTWESKPPTAIDGGQANYNMVLAVSPSDPDVVRAGAVRLFSSQNAGDSWEYTFNGHADQHFIQFLSPNPDFPHRSITAQDGGFNLIWGDGVAFNRRDKNNYYKTTQFYGIDLHPGIGSSDMIGGTQDNGTLFFNEPGEEKVPLSNGDGGFPHIDQDQPHLRITNPKSNNFVVVEQLDGEEIGPSRTILLDGNASFINANDYDDLNNTLYAGTTKSAAFLRIKRIFEDNPIIDYVDINGLPGLSASAVKVSPNDPKTVYVASSNRLYRVNNALDGLSVDADLIFETNFTGFRNITIEKNNEDHIIASMISLDESQEYLWETKNASSGNPSWESFHGDLPKIPVFWVIFMPGNSDQAMIGTEFGIWVTEDIDGANTHWEQCKNGMPNVRVTHLVHRPSDNRIAAASYGRGIFYTQFFEQTYAFFTKDSLHISESDIFTETECRNATEIKIPIEISQLPDTEVTVSVAVNENETTSTEGQDFALPPTQTLTFSPDSALRQFFTLQIFDDAVIENIEQLSISLSINSDDITLSQPSYIIRIEDDESPIRTNPTASVIWEENWIERVDFINKIWKHSPPIRDLQVNQTQYNMWRAGEICNPIDVFSASIWYYNGPEFRYACGYNSGLPSESIMYREVNAQNYEQLQVEFDWKAGGKAGEDYGSVVYSTTTEPFNWIALPTQYAEQAEVQTALVNLPDSLKDRTFQIGWKWTNNGQGTDQQGLAMSVDNIRIQGNLLPTRAENEAAQVSQFVGQHDEVLFFSERERVLAGLNPANNEPPGCASIEVIREEGTSTAFENEAYTGFLLPVHHELNFENAGVATGGLSLFFAPEDIEAFLTTHNISEDSLEVYFSGENNGNEILRIEDRIISTVALTKSISVNTTYSNGQLYLGWLQAVPCTDLSSTIEVTICQGESFEGYSESGTFQDQFTAANGCDSIRTLNLTVLQNKEETLSAIICQGESFEGYSDSGTFQDLFTAANGCDSIRILNLTVLQNKEETLSATICQGESFEGYSESGTFQDLFTAANGCDSIRTLNLTVLQNKEETLSATICQGESFEGYSDSGTFQDQFAAANGCDSIRTLNLTVLQNKEETLSATICQGESFEGYSESGTFQDLFTAANGCDSIRILNLTVLEDRFALLNTTICEGEVFEGYSTTGVYQDQFTGANGCDSIRTLNLTVIPVIETTIDTSICSNVSFEGYSQTGTYQDVFQSAGGCDSVRVLNLTVLPDTDEACQLTNTHEVSLENSIAIFPNPVTQRLQIEWTSRQSSLEFRLLDIRGTLLRNGIFEKDSNLDVSELNRGMYYLQLTDGNSQVVKRFIKL